MTRWKPPLKAKRDAAEPAIFDALRQHGLSVEPTDKPLDAVVGYGGRTYLVEVKTGKGKTTAMQDAFFARWRGHAVVLRSVDDAIQFARHVRAEIAPPGA